MQLSLTLVHYYLCLPYQYRYDWRGGKHELGPAVTHDVVDGTLHIAWPSVSVEKTNKNIVNEGDEYGTAREQLVGVLGAENLSLLRLERTFLSRTGFNSSINIATPNSIPSPYTCSNTSHIVQYSTLHVHEYTLEHAHVYVLEYTY